TLVIDIEEGLKIRKLIRFSHFIRSFERQSDPISRGKLKHQLWLERSLDVEMQLGLRHLFDKDLHCSSSSQRIRLLTSFSDFSHISLDKRRLFIPVGFLTGIDGSLVGKLTHYQLLRAFVSNAL